MACVVVRGKLADRWLVVVDDVSYQEFRTQAEAWRCLDRLLGDPHNAKEARHEWAAGRTE